MDAILQEQGFQQTGACSDASCIVEVGQLLAVHKMLGGSIGLVGRAYSINLRIIDVQSGKIERQVSHDIRSSKEDLVSVHIRNVARQMAGQMKIKKPLTTRAVFWVPAGTVLVGGGAALAYVLLNNETSGPDGDQMQEIQLEIPLQ